MGSRLRIDNNHLFELFVEINSLRDRNHEDAIIIFQFPNDSKDEELLNSIPKFAFPFSSSFESATVDHFTFVLTDIDGKFRFGFCRLSAQSEKCLCLVSYHPWFEIFYRLLNYIHDNKNSDLSSFLSELRKIQDYNPGRIVKVMSSDQTKVFSFDVPNPETLPSIPDNRNLTEYYSAIDTYNMMIIFASMLFERRIIVTSKRLGRLTACLHAASSLLHPFRWQHLYIPVLPPHLIDYCTAPMPFLIGIHSSLFSQSLCSELRNDVVILDADTNTLSYPSDDLEQLPSKVVTSLKRELKAHKKTRVTIPYVLTGQTVSKAFLRTMVTLIGGYRSALVVDLDESIIFDQSIFIASQSLRLQPFLEKVLHFQAFEMFIHQRLTLFNKNPDFVDDFEKEVLISERTRGTDKKSKDKGFKIKSSKNDKTLTGIASLVKATSINTLRSFKMTFNDIRKADFVTVKRANTDPKITAVPRRLTSKESVEGERRSRIGSDCRSLRLSIDDSDALNIAFQQSTLPLLSDKDMDNLFRKYSYDDLASNDFEHVGETSSDESNASRDNLFADKSVCKYEKMNDDTTDTQSMDDAFLLYDDLTSSPLNYLAADDNNDACELQVTDIRSSSALCQTSKLSKSTEGLSMTKLNVSNDVKLTSTAGQRLFDLSSEPKKRISLYLRQHPNVKNIIKTYEMTATPTAKASSLVSCSSSNDSTKSLVAQKAAHYMALDHKVRMLDVSLETSTPRSCNKVRMERKNENIDNLKSSSSYD